MNAHAILERIPALRFLVAGDLWLDRWSKYDPFLTSPSPLTGLEGTVIVATESAPGGCGLAAAALAALGARVSLLGVAGDDGGAFDLRRALERAGVDPSHLLTGPAATAICTRLINTRTDAEDAGRIEVVQFQQPVEIEAEFVESLRRLALESDCVIAFERRTAPLGGLIGPAALTALEALAARLPEQVFWLDAPDRMQQLRAADRPPLLVQPDGQGEIQIIDGASTVTVPEQVPQNPLDPHGAHESFSVAVAAALAAGAPAPDAVRFALLAARVSMMKSGAGCATPGEILRAEKELAE